MKRTIIFTVASMCLLGQSAFANNTEQQLHEILKISRSAEVQDHLDQIGTTNVQSPNPYRRETKTAQSLVGIDLDSYTASSENNQNIGQAIYNLKSKYTARGAFFIKEYECDSEVIVSTFFNRRNKLRKGKTQVAIGDSVCEVTSARDLRQEQRQAWLERERRRQEMEDRREDARDRAREREREQERLERERERERERARDARERAERARRDADRARQEAARRRQQMIRDQQRRQDQLDRQREIDSIRREFGGR